MSLSPDISSGRESAFLRALAGEAVSPPPVWLMRQAGRYLEEYRAVRATQPDFISFCLNPDAASEVTLQPIRRFGFDAAILFADILLIPYGLGQKTWFEPGEGPKLEPLDLDKLEMLDIDRSERTLAPVGETVARVRAGLGPETALIGFAGSPWTVATYMIEGAGSKDRMAARAAAWRDPGRFDALMDVLAEATARYLTLQARSGAQALKLFDSWADGLPNPLFERAVVRPTRAIVDRLRAAGVQVPIIGFARGAGSQLPRYAAETGVDAVALDQGVDPAWARSVLPGTMPVQGQLDAAALLAGGEALVSEIARLLDAWAGRPYVFNLGHGITPDVPVAHVERLLAELRRPR